MKPWALATLESTVRWYVFDPQKIVPSAFELIPELDLKRVPTFGSKESAKDAALGLGLKTWRYVRL